MIFPCRGYLIWKVMGCRVEGISRFRKCVCDSMREKIFRSSEPQFQMAATYFLTNFLGKLSCDSKRSFQLVNRCSARSWASASTPVKPKASSRSRAIVGLLSQRQNDRLPEASAR